MCGQTKSILNEAEVALISAAFFFLDREMEANFSATDGMPAGSFSWSSRSPPTSSSPMSSSTKLSLSSSSDASSTAAAAFAGVFFFADKKNPNKSKKMQQRRSSKRQMETLAFGCWALMCSAQCLLQVLLADLPLVQWLKVSKLFCLEAC